MKENFNKEIVMTKRDGEDFENPSKFWIRDNVYVIGDSKVRDRCHITGKYGGFVYRDCNVQVKLNHKIPIVFQNLKNHDSLLIV